MPTVLRYNSKGPEVIHLRGYLREFGYCDAEDSDIFTLLLRDEVVEFQQTHSGPDGRPLVVDGVVGSNTWWALKRDPHAEESSTHGLTIPAGLTPMRREVLKENLAWLERDVREVPLGSNRGPLIDTCIPDWWFEQYGKNAKGPPWCAAVADQTAYNATGMYPHVSDAHPKGKQILSCYGSATEARRIGQWLVDPASREAARVLGKYGTAEKARRAGYRIEAPTPGDQFVILYRDGAGKLTFKGHKGTLARLDDTHINTFEGNYGNAFRAARRARADITGYVNWFPAHEQLAPDAWEHGTIDIRAPQNKSTR